MITWFVPPHNGSFSQWQGSLCAVSGVALIIAVKERRPPELSLFRDLSFVAGDRSETNAPHGLQPQKQKPKRSHSNRLITTRLLTTVSYIFCFAVLLRCDFERVHCFSQCWYLEVRNRFWPLSYFLLSIRVYKDHQIRCLEPSSDFKMEIVVKGAKIYCDSMTFKQYGESLSM